MGPGNREGKIQKVTPKGIKWIETLFNPKQRVVICFFPPPPPSSSHTHNEIQAGYFSSSKKFNYVTKDSSILHL